MSKIQNSASSGILMPKVVNHFKIIFENFGTNTKNNELTQQVVKCSSPTIDLIQVDLSQFGLTIKQEPNTWNDIKLVLRDDCLNIVHDEVMTQIREQQMADDRYFTLKLQALDGTTSVLNETVLRKCKITKHASNDWDYSSAKAKTTTLFISYTI